MTPRLIESDVPKTPAEFSRFFASGVGPPLSIENARLVGPRRSQVVQFDVMNRTPFPMILSVSARFPSRYGEQWSARAVEFIGPFARDEWQLTVPPGASEADLRVGLFPVELALARRVLPL